MIEYFIVIILMLVYSRDFRFLIGGLIAGNESVGRSFCFVVWLLVFWN